jgi:hypothetical protein
VAKRMPCSQGRVQGEEAEGLPRQGAAARCWLDVSEATRQAEQGCVTRSHAGARVSEATARTAFALARLTPELRGAAKRLPS